MNHSQATQGSDALAGDIEATPQWRTRELKGGQVRQQEKDRLFQNNPHIIR